MTFQDPIPPDHGEPENVGARPGDYCECGFPVAGRQGNCPECGRPIDNNETKERPR